MTLNSPPLLATVVVSLGMAYALGLLARTLRLPPLLGYLLAGVAVGPFTPGFVADQRLTAEMAEIGVALLLFGVGLHFSLGDLLAARQVAVVGALLQVSAGAALGAAIGHLLLGLTPTGSAVFGLALAIASTAVATRALEERGRLSSEAGRIALGWLVVQDLIVIVALVLLPIVAWSGEFSWRGSLGLFGRKLLELSGFVAVVLILGRRVLPWILAFTARAGSRELFTLAVILAALGIAFGSALLFGISLALGAFFAGVVLGESDLSHQAAAESLPIQQVFTVLFFVSVGMLVDPRVLINAPLETLAVLLTILVGTGAVTLLVLLALNVSLTTAATVAAALAQIGEFSFILMTYAVQNDLLPAPARDLVLTGAVLAIALNPLTARIINHTTGRLARLSLLRRLRERQESQHFVPIVGARRARPTDHVVVVGHGRVGQTVTAALQRNAVSYLVVDADRRRVEQLAADQVAVVYGDATRPEVLAASHLESARLLVLALPDAFQARRVIELALELNPTIDTVVRTHSEAEARYLTREAGVGLAVMGEREIALSISDYALRRLGVDAEAAQATVDRLRAEAIEG